MFKETKLGIFSLIAGLFLILISSSFSITGNVVFENNMLDFSYLKILGWVFLLISMILLLGRKSLDAIVIPTGGGEFEPQEEMYYQDEARAKKALRRKSWLDDEGYFVISGKVHDDEKVRGGQSVSIYNYLKRHGIKPGNIMIEGKSKKTMENVIYTLKKIKEREIRKHGKIRRPIRVAFVSYPEHLKRFEDFEKTAIERGYFDRGDFEFHKIRTFPHGKDRKSQRKVEKDYESSPERIIKHAIAKVLMRYMLG
ncbi:hypothetical protein COU59_00445 [Candidatus Pacearchaeota archaeon CG10_big_fil_rev_8_21_14_0_10_34_12]|nr:MAG: hypothetical protein COU59_00445 [Candidatus Pacearchaeota archaeon CG10_big_fil_rev_8_21_14_0_10_34_12]